MTPSAARALEYQVLLISAAQDGGLAEVKYLVEKDGADVNGGGIFDETPLHWASMSGQTAVCQFLIEQGADINSKDKVRNSTPLHWACINGYIETAKCLISNGADLNSKDREGLTPLHCASSGSRWDLVRLLIERGADVRECKDICMFATVSGKLGMVKYLLAKGATADHPNENGMTPLTWAVRQRGVELVQLLLEHGASIDIQDQDGMSPLECALNIGFLDAVYWMIRTRPQMWSRFSKLFVKTPVTAS